MSTDNELVEAVADEHYKVWREDVLVRIANGLALPGEPPETCPERDRPYGLAMARRLLAVARPVVEREVHARTIEEACTVVARIIRDEQMMPDGASPEAQNAMECCLRRILKALASPPKEPPP